MRRCWLLVVVGPVVVACTGASSQQPTLAQPGPASSARAAPRLLIDVRPFTITLQGHPIARLLADGRTESVGPNPPGDNATFVPGPTLHGDGTIALTKEGFTARVESNGDIYVVGPPGQSPREQRFGRISGDRLSVEMSGESGGVRIDGATLKFDAPSSHDEIGTIEGTVDASLRHTALVMTAAFFIELSITEQ